MASDGRWLVAPYDADINVLLKTVQRLDLDIPDIAITTPRHFDALVRYRLGPSVATRASAALTGQWSYLSAKGALDRKRGVVAAAFIVSAVLGLWSEQRFAIDVIGMVFFAAMLLRTLVCAAGVERSAPALPVLFDDELPSYTVLVALYNEPLMIPGLVSNLRALDYPRSKLDILILIEIDDAATRDALEAERLPPYMRVVIVPDGKPRTKPRALNVGLMMAKGDYVTVYDAEDRPDPDQLLKAVARFRDAPPNLACLQAQLAIGNGAHGILPRLFAIEYAGLFDLLNVGCDRWGVPIALGGTSNHFKTSILRQCGGWDAWNVTEDADLGLRLARFGYAVGHLDSSTGEEAPERLDVWFKQRQRWTKGWMQTLLVLVRDGSVLRDLGLVRTLVVAMMLTSLVTGPLLTPFAIVFALWHVASNGMPNPEGFFQIVEATLAIAVFVMGIASTLWCGYAGMRARRLTGFLMSLPALVPYQLLISAAAWGGLYDLVIRPYHWRKTPHRPARAKTAG